MRVNVKTKYDIGQTVKMKEATQRFLIGGINVETCPGGTQIHYSGMVQQPRDSFRTEKRVEWYAEKSATFNEIYLEGLDKEDWKPRKPRKI